MASVIGVTPAVQALSLDSARRRPKAVCGNVVSMLSSSFLGDTSQLILCPYSVSQGSVSRTFHALCVRADPSGSHLLSIDASAGKDDTSSSWNLDKTWPYQASSQRAAVATADYVIAEDNVDILGYRRQRSIASDDRANVDFVRKSDSGTRNAEVRVAADFGGSDISRLGLKEELVQALAKRGITQLFPIQEAVLKPAMKGTDIIARAKTGTGKTLAFGIPIIQSLLEQDSDGRSMRRFARVPRALVLAPTRELAVQVEKEFMESAPNLSTLCVYGGVSIISQQRRLQKGVDVAVGTPGRVIDLIARGSLVLNEVKFMVLDEADQMLAVGFEEDVEKILEELPTNRQSMLFSATMPSWVSRLANKYLKSPLTIDLVGDSDEKLAEGIKMYSIAIPVSAKRSILSDLITVYGKGGKTIVFTQTKKDADEVAMSMSRMLGTEALHGDISQAQREKTLTGFRNGKFSVLVATDVAARGLDIPNVDLVIHYEIPNDPETFVHRSGRTGRAGKEGITLLMYSESQSRTMRTIERDVGCKFTSISPPNVYDVLQSSSAQAEEALSKVHPELKSIFLPTAEKLLKEQGPEALAAAIAHLSGYTQPPSSRSLITHEQGWTTLQITRTQAWGARLSSARSVMGALSAIYPRAADEVGKIQILDEQEGDGAVFDLPEDVAKELLSKDRSSEDSISVISKLPRLQYDDEAPRDRYGRFSQRGGSARTFGSGGRSDWSPRRRQDERSLGMTRDWSRGRRQEERPSSTTWGDEWSANSRNQVWSSGPNDNWRASSQGCFICGEVGHRAAVCPKRSYS